TADLILMRTKRPRHRRVSRCFIGRVRRKSVYAWLLRLRGRRGLAVSRAGSSGCSGTGTGAHAHHEIAGAQHGWDKGAVLEFAASHYVVAHLEVGEGHALAVLAKRGVLVNFDGLGLAVGTIDGDLESIDGLDLADDELLAEVFGRHAARAAHHHAAADEARVPNAVAAPFAGDHHLVAGLEVGQPGFLLVFHEARVGGCFHGGVVAAHGLDGERVTIDGSDGAAHAHAAEALAALATLRLSWLPARRGLAFLLRQQRHAG